LADFINDIYEFISFYGVGELFDTRLYNKPRRRQSDLIFCNVQFEEYGKTYCYLTDNDELCEGDRVVVSAGTDNHEAIARIESIDITARKCAISAGESQENHQRIVSPMMTMQMTRKARVRSQRMLS
jgi:hypothetical protein